MDRHGAGAPHDDAFHSDKARNKAEKRDTFSDRSDEALALQFPQRDAFDAMTGAFGENQIGARTCR